MYTRIGCDEIEEVAARLRRLFDEFLLDFSGGNMLDSTPSEEDISKMLQVSLILIFTAHATITDAQKPSLAEAFEVALPKLSFDLIRDFCFALCDRITDAPSIWQMSLTPLFIWLSLHNEDGLFASLATPELKTELSRVHLLLHEYLAHQQQKSTASEEAQIELLELVGTRLMYEERFCVGFLPLQTYFDKSKQIGSGLKCPTQNEDLVRSII